MYNLHRRKLIKKKTKKEQIPIREFPLAWFQNPLEEKYSLWSNGKT